MVDDISPVIDFDDFGKDVEQLATHFTDAICWMDMDPSGLDPHQANILFTTELSDRDLQGLTVTASPFNQRISNASGGDVW